MLETMGHRARKLGAGNDTGCSMRAYFPVQKPIDDDGVELLED
jgi:hypothetical protein